MIATQRDSPGHARWIGATVAIAILGLALGCEPYRVEYHRRPSYYDQAALGELRNRERLSDGTVVVYRDTDSQKIRADDGNPRKQFKIREEMEDGTIELRAIMPEHILANLIECLHNEEYDLIYEQLLSKHTREAWESDGGTMQDFAEHLAASRREMILALTRMHIGISRLEALVEREGGGVIECRLRPHIAEGLKFSRVRMIEEGLGLKLLNVL